MNLTLPKDDIIENFLSPISKVTDRCILTLKGSKIEVLIHSTNDGLILIGEYILAGNVDPAININIGDLKRFIKVLECIPDDPQDKNEVFANISETCKLSRDKTRHALTYLKSQGKIFERTIPNPKAGKSPTTASWPSSSA